MLLGTLGANLLRNILEDKEEIRAENGVIRVGQCFNVVSTFD